MRRIPRRPYAANQSELRSIGRQIQESGQGPVKELPSQPGALQSEQGLYVRLPGATNPPAGAIPVDVIGDANIAPGASATLVTVPVPDTLRLRIAGIGFTADDDIALGYLSWAVNLGPDPVQGYFSVLAAIGSIRQLAEVFILAGSSQTLTVKGSASALAPLTYRYICRVRGWFYNEKEER